METLINDFTELPNIGLVLAKNIISIDIKSVEEFKQCGAERAFIRIRAIDKGACLNQLYALEGAIQGIRWHDLDKNRKEELKHFYNQLGRE